MLVCDYVIVRRGILHVDELYSAHGRYAYGTGVNRAAMIALAGGILAALAGLIAPALRFLFDGAWFSAAIVSGAVYVVMTRGRVREVATRQFPTSNSQGTLPRNAVRAGPLRR